MARAEGVGSAKHFFPSCLLNFINQNSILLCLERVKYNGSLQEKKISFTKQFTTPTTPRLFTSADFVLHRS